MDELEKQLHDLMSDHAEALYNGEIDIEEHYETLHSFLEDNEIGM